MQDIADNSESTEEVWETVNSLPVELKMKIVYELRKDETFEDQKYWAIWLIDLMDQYNLVNDYTAGTSKREVVVGFLLAVAGMYSQSADLMYRAELQTQTERSQFGLSLAEQAHEYSEALTEIATGIRSIDCAYNGILKGRQCDFHFTDDEGAGVSYAAEEIEKRAAINEDLERRRGKQIDDMRAMLSDSYWGRGLPQEIEEGGTAQLIIPLWEVMDKAEEKSKKEPALAGP